MKKIISVLTAVTLTATLFTSCAASDDIKTDENSLNIGLVQLMEHPSLDEIRNAVTTQIEKTAPSLGLSVNVEYQNGQNDSSIVNTICQQFVADEKDLIIAIATPAAQAATAAVEGTDIPVIFSAVSDPVAAGLVDDLVLPGRNVTGTSDAIDVAKIFNLADEITPDIKTFGLLYSTSEDNSASVIKNATVFLKSRGIAIKTAAVTTIGDVQTATTTLIDKVDAIFVPIDNTIASAMPAVAEIAGKAKIPVYVSADTMVLDGGLATVGINYTELGKKTADIALRVLGGETAGEIPVEILTDNKVIVNEETAALIGADISKYIN